MKGRLFLVSDTMPTFGSDITSFTIGDERISLENGRLRSRDGRLAGAHLGLDRAVRVMIEDAGVAVAEALHMASGIPASVLGLEDQLGSIAVGRPVSLTPRQLILRPSPSPSPAGYSAMKAATAAA